MALAGAGVTDYSTLRSSAQARQLELSYSSVRNLPMKYFEGPPEDSTELPQTNKQKNKTKTCLKNALMETPNPLLEALSVVGCIPVMLNTFLSQITQWRPCSVDHGKDTDYPMTILLTSLTLQGCSLVSFSGFIWNGCDAFYHLDFNKMHFCPCYVWSVIPPPVSVVLTVSRMLGFGSVPG